MKLMKQLNKVKKLIVILLLVVILYFSIKSSNCIENNIGFNDDNANGDPPPSGTDSPPSGIQSPPSGIQSPFQIQGQANGFTPSALEEIQNSAQEACERNDGNYKVSTGNCIDEDGTEQGIVWDDYKYLMESESSQSQSPTLPTATKTASETASATESETAPATACDTDAGDKYTKIKEILNSGTKHDKDDTGEIIYYSAIGLLLIIYIISIVFTRNPSKKNKSAAAAAAAA